MDVFKFTVVGAKLSLSTIRRIAKKYGRVKIRRAKARKPGWGIWARRSQGPSGRPNTSRLSFLFVGEGAAFAKAITALRKKGLEVLKSSSLEGGATARWRSANRARTKYKGPQE